MADTSKDDDCVSKKPWSEVLSRSLKLFTFNAAREGGKSFGRVIFFILLGVIVLLVATYVIDSMTGWFSSWFDFWPFNRAQEAAVAPDADKSWWPWGSEPETEVSAQDGEAKWYCKWNPLC